MKNHTLLKEARLYFVPILLGSNKRSHRISRKIFRKYGIVSLILDEKASLRDAFSLSSKFVQIYCKDGELLCSELCALVRSEPYCLPLLVATAPRFEAFLDEFAPSLEPRFIICKPDELFSLSPLASIKDFKKGGNCR